MESTFSLFLFHCCLLASLLFLTAADSGLVRHIMKRRPLDNADDRCTSELVARQQAKSFTSPLFPRNYPNDADCSWRMRTYPGNQITLSFVSFDVEHERNCQYDYLIIYDGPDASYPPAGRYCGNVIPTDFTSSTGQVFVKFHSDEADNMGGFEIQFQAIGQFGSDGAAGGGDGDGGGSVGGGGDDGSSSGDGDGVEVVTGSDNIDGSMSVQESSMSSVQESSNDDNTENGDTTIDPGDAQQQGTIEVDGCNQIWHDALYGNITSPGYPSLYPGNADCTIVINAPPGHEIILTFHFFDLEEFYCSFDYVLIMDSVSEDATLLGTYCGHGIPGPVQSSTNVLVVKFVSDASDEKGGFSASFRSHDVNPANPVINDSSYADINEPAANSSNQRHPANVLEFVHRPVDMPDLQPGDLVELECSVNQESAVVQWFKEDKELLADEETDGILVVEEPLGSTLMIRSIEASHEGVYLCQARLPGKQPILAAITLQIADEVVISIESPDYSSDYTDTDGLFMSFQTVPDNATVTDGTDQIFTCSATGGHLITWEKDGRRIVYNQRIYLIFADNLLVGNARVRDSGRYSCVAYSESGDELGRVSAYFTVTSGLDVTDVCGIVRAEEAANDKSTEDNSRIVNGQTAKKGSSPWIARLWHLHSSKHFCGGSLISNRWVVTAAHCITKNSLQARDIEIRLGDHDSLNIESSEMKFRVSQIVLYRYFNRRTYDGDIALLELDQRVPVFTDYVSPICLPNARTRAKVLVPGKEARIVGWGRIIEKGAFPRYLRELYIPIIPETTCRESTDERITDNMFCAGFRQASQGDACQGDSGGPLAMKKGGKWYLMGIISWGEGCAREGHYGFYTNVVNFISWMRDSMN